jgi:hypothetical protein
METIRPPLSEKAELEVLAVLRALKAVVAEAGDDFVYQQGPSGECYYVVNDQPSCIAAKVLHRLGIPVDLLRAWEGQRVDLMNYNNFAGSQRPTIDFGNESLRVLRSAQLMQDQGRTWGDCRDRALYIAYHEFGVIGA